MFDELYVIHCKRLAERRLYLEPILRNLGWRAQWIDSCDPDEIPRRHLLNFGSGARNLTAGEISVYLKHLEALRRIAGRERSVGLVIEDDTVFPPNFPAAFAQYGSALREPFDLVFFGSCEAAGEQPREVGSLFAKSSRTRSMSGYLVTTSAASRLLAQMDGRPILQPIDHTVNGILRAGAFNVLWSLPPLLLNGSETKLFGHSLGVPWREGLGRPGLYRRARRGLNRIAAAMAVRR